MNKTSRWVLLASLVLNLLFLGVILGRVPHGLDRPPTRQQRMEEALKKLPEEAQGRFREKLAQIRAAGDPLREHMDTARNDTLRVMETEPFDEAAYDRQAEKFHELRRQMFMRMSQTIKQIVKELAPDERRMFADLLRRPPPPPKKD